MVLGLSPYLLITPLVAYFKLKYRNKKSIILYAITIFFAIQEPFLAIIKKDTINYNNKKIESLMIRKEKLQKDNDLFSKRGAYGLYKQNSKDIIEIDKEIKQLETKKIDKNIYVSLLEILIIFLVEYMLYVQLKYSIKKEEKTINKGEKVENWNEI